MAPARLQRARLQRGSPAADSPGAFGRTHVGRWPWVSYTQRPTSHTSLPPPMKPGGASGKPSRAHPRTNVLVRTGAREVVRNGLWSAHRYGRDGDVVAGLASTGVAVLTGPAVLGELGLHRVARIAVLGAARNAASERMAAARLQRGSPAADSPAACGRTHVGRWPWLSLHPASNLTHELAATYETRRRKREAVACPPPHARHHRDGRPAVG